MPDRCTRRQCWAAGAARLCRRLPCFGAALGVLPAFGAFTGLQVVRPAPGEQVYAIADDRVVPLPALPNPTLAQ